MTESIIQKDKMCVVCGRTEDLERHHVMFGNPRRRLAEEDGLVVWLCAKHHRGADGVHGIRGHLLDIYLKTLAQSVYEKTHTRDEWMARYRRNYL